MEKNPRKANKPLYIVLSIIIACCLWLYVRNVDNSDRQVTYSGIPVTFVGEDVLNSKGLMLVNDGSKQTISLELQGKWDVLSRLRRDNITITADLSRISAEGEYNLAYDIALPNTVSNDSVSVLDRNPFYVGVTVTKRETRQIPLKGVFTGSVAKGYQAEEFVFQPSAIEISGEIDLVNQVAYAQVELNREELAETVREEMSYTLMDADGQPIANKAISASPATVGVTLPVVMVKEVPLTVDLISGGGVNAESEHVEVSFEPETIMLSGAEDDLAAYTSINLGSVDLSKVIGSDSFVFAIPLGQEMQNVSGVQEATVKVTVKGLSTITLETDDIEIINAPEGVVTPVTKSLQVQIRGSEEALEQVLPQYIRVVVDLKDLTLPAGQNVVTAKVTLGGISEAGVIGEYKVSIDLKRGIG